MWKYHTPDELYHHGILGMRWGHRKSKKAKNIISKIKKEYNIYKEANKKDKSVKIANIIGGTAAIGAGGIYGFSKTSGIYNNGMRFVQTSLKGIGNLSLTYGTAVGLLNYKNYKNSSDYKKYKINKNQKDNKNNKKWSTKKKIVVTGAIAAGAVLGGIGAKKVSSYIKSKNREITTMNGWKEYFKNINKGKSFKESINKYYNITNKANNNNFRTSLRNVIKSR